MEKTKTKEKSSDKYTEAIGRRKTSTARVRITPSSKASFIVNEKEAKEYFQTEEMRRLIQDPIVKGAVAMEGKVQQKWKIEAKVVGGGQHSQAEAVRHGLARAMSEVDTELRPKMKTLGYLKRDSRSKERRKFGLKKARKAPQWSKR